MNWEIGIYIYTLIYIKWITNVLYKKINKIKFKKKKLQLGQKSYFIISSCEVSRLK